MGLLRWHVLLLLGALLERGCGASSHSLRYFLTGVTEPGPGLPAFIAVGYVDGQLITQYDSITKTKVPRVPWMERVGQDDPQYWAEGTQNLQGTEAVFRANLGITMQCYNQSGGFHTFQVMFGCELGQDGTRRGHEQYSYDGRDFIAFDKDTRSWTATVPEAGISKRKWDADSAWSDYLKAYLEEECIAWLSKYLDYGRESLLRTVPPEVKVTHKDSKEGLETLLCQAHGFYPNEIVVTWRKDGEVRQEDTFRGVVSPNLDGTYYTWLSIEIDPQERSRYRCHVEHDGLEKPLDVAVPVKTSGSVWLFAVGVVVAIVLVLCVAVAGFILYKKQRDKPAYTAASSEMEVETAGV